MRFLLIVLCFVVGCGPAPRMTTRTNYPVYTAPKAPQIVNIKPGPQAAEELLTALIKAKPNTTINLEAGTYEFTGSLSLTKPMVTIKGAGMDKTILSFKKQDQGKEGLLVTTNDFHIEGLTIEDTKGDALKVMGGINTIIKQVRARWTGGPKETNGGYGLYPVQCFNVLIDGCEAECASDAGIYVGQSKDVIIRHCKASRNVAGIEVENSTNVDVYENITTNNSGGLLVFDLPNLPVKNGKSVRVFKNQSHDNNHPNFAPKGNMVATVPPGTGMMILAMDQVELFENQIKNNNTVGLSIVSFHLTQKEMNDKNYDPYPEGIYIHDNQFADNGTKPGGEMGLALGGLLGKPLPDILYDGNVDAKKKVDGKTPENLSLRLSNNGNASFVNLNYDGSDVLKFALSKPKIERNAAAFEGKLPSLPVVSIKQN